MHWLRHLTADIGLAIVLVFLIPLIIGLLVTYFVVASVTAPVFTILLYGTIAYIVYRKFSRKTIDKRNGTVVQYRHNGIKKRTRDEI